MHRGPIAEIDLRAVASNLRNIKSFVSNLPIMAVVKADAYGHGAVKVSKTLLKEGVEDLVVAYCSEAVELRESGIGSRILVLFDGGSNPDVIFKYNLTPVVHNLKSAKILSKEAKKRGKTLDIHIKADTGMGRTGFSDIKDILSASELPNLKISGLMSHFSESDILNSEYTKEQLRKFLDIRKNLIKKGLRPICHIANSSAIVNFKDTLLDAVRPGLMLYGWDSPHFKHALRVYAPIIALRRLKKGSPVSYGRTFITTRNTLTAVLGIGYADGYLRALSNSSYVILDGRRAPVIGRVCMDLIVADVTEIDGLREGDMATLLGPEITAWEVSKWAGTIPYEIMTSLGNRVRRLYKE